MSAEKPETPQELADARLVEAILNCRTHRAAQDLVQSLRESGRPPRRGIRTSPHLEDVPYAIGRSTRLLNHSDLIDHLVETLGITERQALAAAYEAYDTGLVKVYRSKTGTYYGATS